ncbi:acyl-CoA thioesterase/BAAT N-terminal domain-containing protein [Leifsonia sp. NPDC058230]|uniref:acyl-CoA thioesterase/bile acid-CoA:amino acid N-acyltransferase family protein n=1 Tax=Leifsonia sp. NPDC058230 TaxID=3346391 RepID=UPI0036DE9C8C
MRWRRDARRAAIVVAFTVIAGLVLSGCSAPPGSRGQVGPRFVTPPLIHYTSVLWPVPLQLIGAEPGSRVRLVASMPTPQGRWSSEATYTIPLSGTLDLARARPQLAPFASPDSAGLFWSLRGPELSPSAQIEKWMGSTAEVTIDAVQGGRIVASRLFRLDGLGANLRPSRVYDREFVEAAVAAGDLELPQPETDPPWSGGRETEPVADFYSARSIERPRTPAVIVFDDTSPGASSDFVAPLLAAFGAAVLVLPSGGAANGAQTVNAINASTVEAALDWLDARDDIDGRNIFVYGSGPAEQFALWSAVRFSDRIVGAFGSGGSTALLCMAGSPVSAAFENGIGVPCQADAGRVDRGSIFALDDIRGPVVLGCGGRDEVLLNACRWLDAAVEVRGVHAGDGIVRARDAAHPITVPPGLPIDLADPVTAEATEQARIAFWNAVARILLRAGRS